MQVGKRRNERIDGRKKIKGRRKSKKTSKIVNYNTERNPFIINIHRQKEKYFFSDSISSFWRSASDQLVQVK